MTSKRKESLARVNAQTCTAVAVRRDVPMPESKGNVQLAVGMADLRSMAVAEARNRLLEARAIATSLMTEANNRYARCEGSLTAAANALITQTTETDKQLRDFIAALSAWTGSEYVAGFISREYGGYSEVKPAVIDIEKGEIVGKWQISRRQSSRVSELDKNDKIPFTPEMRELVEKLAAAKIDVDKAQADLTSVNRQIAELPHKGDAIQSALTRAHLLGQLQDTSKILDVITQSLQVISLPESVSLKMLPALPVT